MKEESKLRSALSDILNGFCFYKNEDFYIKHLTLDDYVDFEYKYDSYYGSLRKKKVLNNKELISQAKARDLWSNQEEYKIEDLETLIKNTRESSEKLLLYAQKEAQLNYIKELEEELFILKNKKKSFLNHSCESLAERKVNEYYLLNSLFKDKDFKKPLFTEEEKEDVSLNVAKYFKIQAESLKNISADTIKMIATKEFFTSGWRICNNAFEYFGKPISRLSFHQTNLANYAKTFTVIFERYPNINSEDPDEIIRLANSRSKLEEKSNGGDVDVVGMTHEEADKMGIKLKDRSRQFSESLQ